MTSLEREYERERNQILEKYGRRFAIVKGSAIFCTVCTILLFFFS